MKAHAIRQRLGHPVLDADGHVLEYMPAVTPFLREVLGPRLFERWQSSRSPLARIMEADPARRRANRAPQSAWWGTPAKNTRDLATAVAPALLHERLPELGIDYAVLYPTKGFGIAGIDDDELRQGVCRAFNTFYAATYAPHAERMTVAGVIPMHTPEEALAELDHCARLGFKIVAFPEGVMRPIPEPDDAASPFLMPGQRTWFDSFGIDSLHDYDPVWQRAHALGFPVTFHAGLGHVPISFTSISNYSFNHVGAFAQRMHVLVKALFMGGVTRRMPGIDFAVLECGVGWASILLHDLVEHWEKRNPVALAALDPEAIDWAELERLMQTYGRDLLERAGHAAPADLAAGLATLPATGEVPAERDDWRMLGVGSEAELVALFAPRFYFGCEADDKTVAFAFSKGNPERAALRPILSSDLGHWDAGELDAILPEAWSLVERGLLDEGQFDAFVWRNPASLLLRANPRFFEGTALAGAPLPSIEPAP
ncbi:MAG: amidohydrolase family protein [Myxococcota bacterium]